MKITTTPPPNYDQIRKAFGVDFDKGVIFTYWPNVHFYKDSLPPDLVVHEGTHLRQQEEYPGGVEAWWARYLTDPVWRLSQELEAYRAQWRWLLKNERNRNTRQMILVHCAKDLSGTMYGSVITFEEAKLKIQMP